MLSDKILLDQIHATTLRRGECALWWLGQSGFVIKLGRTVIGLDLFLSEHPRRLIPPLFSPQTMHGFDFILGTHDHRDHIDREAWPAMARAMPDTVFIVPAGVQASLVADGVLPAQRMIGLDDSTCYCNSELRVTGIAAAHELLQPDPISGRYSFLGYVIEGNGFTFYHAGDCCIYEGLQTRLARWHLDLGLLPINGRDAEKLAVNLIGNMTWQEAVDLAGALKPGLTIPLHFDMFARNSENPQLFLDYMRVKYPELKTKLAVHGQRMIIRTQNRKNYKNQPLKRKVSAS